jgi:3-oxoadipyl-CoA thiolase
MADALICDAVRTPIGRFGGSLSNVRTDDLAALPIKTLMERHPGADWSCVDEVVFGCANQAGEDNRNVARMAALLASLPPTVPGLTVNRLCASGLDAIGAAARAIKVGEADLAIAGGVESMSRAPYVLAKASSAFARDQNIEDTTIGWRFINPAMRKLYGVDSMPETAENVADEWIVGREEQDLLALASQERAAAAQASGRFAVEIAPVQVGRPGATAVFDRDEHPRRTTIDGLAALRPIVRPNGTVTAGNASGVNDGAAAMLIASGQAAKAHRLIPRARIVGMAAAGVPPRIMGVGPVDAARKVLNRAGIGIGQLDVIELNEAFAAQAIAVLHALGLRWDDPRVNPNGGAIALGHPLGMSGVRLVLTATEQLCCSGGQYALCFMCVGVGQGVAMLIERVGS